MRMSHIRICMYAHMHHRLCAFAHVHIHVRIQHTRMYVRLNVGNSWMSSMRSIVADQYAKSRNLPNVILVANETLMFWFHK